MGFSEFRIDLNLLNQHMDGEQRGKRLAAELLEEAENLLILSTPEMKYRYRSFRDEAEKLYQYFCRVEDAMEEIDLEARLTSKRIQDVLDESIFEVASRGDSYDDLQTLVDSMRI